MGDALGAINGSHVAVAAPGYAAVASRNRKGFFSQNYLFVCGFDLMFKYDGTGRPRMQECMKVLLDAV